MNPVAAAGRGTRWLRFGRRCAHGKINRLTLQKRSTVWCSFFRALLVRHSRRFEHESRGRRHWDKWHHKAVAVRWGSILAREALLKHRWGEAEWRERRSEPLTAALSPTAGSASRRSPAKSPRGPCRTFCHLKKRKIRCVDRAEKVKRKKLKVISVAPPSTFTRVSYLWRPGPCQGTSGWWWGLSSGSSRSGEAAGSLTTTRPWLPARRCPSLEGSSFGTAMENTCRRNDWTSSALTPSDDSENVRPF